MATKQKNPPGALNKHTGWLNDDGIVDTLAAWMAAFDRTPVLTFREALLAVYYMMKDNRDSTHIAIRLKITQDRASGMMKKVRDEHKGEFPEKVKVWGKTPANN